MNVPVDGREKVKEISIWLDEYEDTFSDFDPRPFSKRALSDDFVSQAKKLARDQSGRFRALKLLLPESKRDSKLEIIIAERLKNFFSRNYEQLILERGKNYRRGAIMTISGITLLIAASYLAYLKIDSFYITLLLTLFEPGGWFMLWTGLDHFVFYSKTSNREIGFYSRMTKADILFGSY